jgi:2-polyprenyl-6-methoxyphenol hydroxylase-like FAD-dependent oxidoreductase
MNTPLVLIVGAGPTGMTMAIELRRAGLDVRIIDKSDHPALHSQALVLQARTLEQMQRYGLAEKAVARGRKLKRAELWSEGKQILSIPLEGIPSRYPYVLFLPQSETEFILNECMESMGMRAERRTELISFLDHGEGIAARLRLPSGAEERMNARWIVGCDGAHSLVRDAAGIPFEGGGVGVSFFLGDLELEGADVPEDALTIHLHRGNVVFLGRLSDRFTRVIVALHARQGEAARGEVSVADFQQAMDEAGMRARILSSDWMTPFHVNDLQARHYRAGNVFLAGDASHIHSPVGGQGMNTGMQDAANLAWKLAAVARGADEALLDSYEEERGAVGKALLKFTERTLKMATATNPLVQGLRDALLPMASSLTSVQKGMLGFVSETAIHYRDSSIVEDHGGDGSLRAGDRMPDFGIGEEDTGTTLFEGWTDPRHLALLLNSSGETKDRIASHLTHAQVASVRLSELGDEGRALLGKEEKLLVVRPDGYIGFRAPVAKHAELEAYARREALSPSVEPRKEAVWQTR